MKNRTIKQAGELVALAIQGDEGQPYDAMLIRDLARNLAALADAEISKRLQDKKEAVC